MRGLPNGIHRMWGRSHFDPNGTNCSMISKTDFTDAEWHVVREVPHLVVVAAASATASGLIGSLKEAVAPAAAMLAAIQGDNTLLRDVCDPAEWRAAVSEIREAADQTEFNETQAYYHRQAVTRAQEAMTVIKAKGHAEDAAGYAAFLMDLALRVAAAAREGGFMGFGGEPISDGERVFLSDLGEVLGLPVEHAFVA